MAESSPVDPPISDVRMRGFVRRTTVSDALAWVDQHVSPLDLEQVDLNDAAGRVLGSDMVSSVDVPQFDRSMMDGFALLAEDTLGATAYNRLLLEIVGQSMPGSPWEGVLGRGQAVRIMTGSPIPNGANAVLPAEKVEVAEQQLFLMGEVSPGKNVGRVGEDIVQGDKVLSAGRRLRPQDIGVLSSIGTARVPVVRRVRVTIVVTGNELVPAGSQPQKYQISDANGPMLNALVERDGGIALNPGIISDQPESILKALRSDADIVIVSGGSSVGIEDHAPMLVAEHGELAIHGIAMRPSSPTGMGIIENRLVFLLPGNPVSCLCAYDFFAGRAIRVLAGRGHGFPYITCRLPLARKLVSTIGRVDYARVKLGDDGVEPLSIGGASVLSSTTRADGFIVVSADSEGFPEGAQVDVLLYDDTGTR